MNERSPVSLARRIPFIPETAPFTPAQRAWLNGFLAGMFSAAAGSAATTSSPPAVKTTVNVLFGSESGNAEALARRVAKAAQQRGFESKAISLEKVTVKDLARERCVLIITSTFGDGEPPENAKRFHAQLHGPAAGRLDHLSYAVLALGDKNYPQFCQCGIEIDRRLEALGATRIYQRVDCDADYQAEFQRWETGVFGVLDATASDAGPVATSSDAFPPGTAAMLADDRGDQPAVMAEREPAKSYSRAHPFPGRLMANRKLSAEGSAKETRHFEISLAGSGLVYEAGDALGVHPANCPALVDDLLLALNCDGEEAVSAPDGSEVSLRTALLRHYAITKVPALLLEAIAERSGDRMLSDLLQPDAGEALADYLAGREIIDLLAEFPAVRFSANDFAGLLRPLQPRLYSISSTLKAHPDQVHLTIATVRYQSCGRMRKGVCSTFLADRANSAVPIFVQVAPHFRLPPGGDTPIIMVGPGTGVAPFRAFLHERRTAGATGRNWLFFGEQRAATDFFYRDELEPMLADGHLTRLSTAFSRDQAEKVYVQDRMIENGAELWAWLEDGAHFYVCGDARRMARDVDAALRAVIQQRGGLSAEAAAEYIENLKRARRYQRDVY